MKAHCRIGRSQKREPSEKKIKKIEESLVTSIAYFGHNSVLWRRGGERSVLSRLVTTVCTLFLRTPAEWQVD